MGIVNVTPDSFSDGGQHASTTAALSHCERLLRDGADILDIGGESTRPGALALPVEEELARVMPVIRHAVTLGVPVSVDTYKPQVMRAALEAGVDIVNDVWAMRWQDPDNGQTAREVIADHSHSAICVMHMHGEPRTMQLSPMQGDVVEQVRAFLLERVGWLEQAGVNAARICIDPGIGFGKTVAQNFALLAQQEGLCALGYPLLAGWSRKSSLAAVTQTSLSAVASLSVPDRMVPSVVAAVLAAQRGARVLRVHDVRETVQALKVLAALRLAQPGPFEETG
jgi:dihydropteroate synthase